MNWRPYAKAIAAAVAALVAGLALVVTGNEGLSDVTVAEWLVVIGATIGTSGVVYAVPNRDA